MRFKNGKSFSHYRVLFPELLGEGKIPMQIAELELLPKLEGSPVDDSIKEATSWNEQIAEVTQKVRYVVSGSSDTPWGRPLYRMVLDSETMSYSMAWTNDQSLKASGMPL